MTTGIPPGSERLVAILGVGRNGSTLLMRLLDGSPGIWMYPIELNWLSILESGPDIPFRLWGRAQQDELRESYFGALVEPVEPAEDPVAALLADEPTPEHRIVAYLEAFRRAYGAGRRDETALLAFKTIEGAAAAEYERLFPKLRCIHIVREPDSAYASLKRTDMLQKRKPFWFQGDLLRTFLERRWIPHVRLALAAAQRDPRRARIVRYEDLVADPSAVVGDLCGWLGVPPPLEPDVQTVLGGRAVTALPSNTSQQGVATPIRVVPDLAARFHYEDVVTARERDFIAYRTAELARRLGYETGAPPRRSRLRLLAAWALPDSWELMNVHSRIAFGRAFVRRRAYLAGKLLAP